MTIGSAWPVSVDRADLDTALAALGRIWLEPRHAAWLLLFLAYVIWITDPAHDTVL